MPAMADDGALVDVPDVVNGALNHIATKQGFKKPRFHVESATKIRDGFMSTLFRCVISDEDSAGAADLQVMAKISREGMETMMAHLFGVEGLVYTDLFPVLEELAALRDPLPWPKHYFSSVKGGHPYCLVLEDFGLSGFVMADRNKPLDTNHIRLAMNELAKFHGSSMALERLRPDLFKSLNECFPLVSEDPSFMKVMVPFVEPLPTLPGLLLDKYPEGSEVHTVLVKLCNVMTTQFAKLMWPRPPEHGRGCAFVHGDCHMNNMAFKYDKDGAVTGCKLYDFQGVNYRMVAQDFAWLLFCNTDKELRDRDWDSLLQGYIAKVHEVLRTCGLKDPEDILTLDMLKEQLRRYVGPMTVMRTIMESVLLGDDALVDELRTGLAEGAKPEGEKTSSLRPTPVVLQRCVDMVESARGWGWFPSLEDIDRFVAEG